MNGDCCSGVCEQSIVSAHVSEGMHMSEWVGMCWRIASFVVNRTGCAMLVHVNALSAPLPAVLPAFLFVICRECQSTFAVAA